MKIKKVRKLVTDMNISEHIIQIRNLQQALNHGLILKKVNRVINFNQND